MTYQIIYIAAPTNIAPKTGASVAIAPELDVEDAVIAAAAAAALDISATPLLTESLIELIWASTLLLAAPVAVAATLLKLETLAAAWLVIVKTAPEARLSACPIALVGLAEAPESILDSCDANPP
jgi:hypothetical protein